MHWLDGEKNADKELIRYDFASASLPKNVAEFDDDKYKDCLTDETSELESNR